MWSTPTLALLQRPTSTPCLFLSSCDERLTKTTYYLLFFSLSHLPSYSILHQKKRFILSARRAAYTRGRSRGSAVQAARSALPPTTPMESSARGMPGGGVMFTKRSRQGPGREPKSGVHCRLFSFEVPIRGSTRRRGRRSNPQRYGRKWDVGVDRVGVRIKARRGVGARRQEQHTGDAAESVVRRLRLPRPPAKSLAM